MAPVTDPAPDAAPRAAHNPNAVSVVAVSAKYGVTQREVVRIVLGYVHAGDADLDKPLHIPAEVTRP